MAYDNAWLQDLFDRRFPEIGLSAREEQRAMANYVQTSLTTGRHLLAEAGVGTGKSYAYLIPAYAHLKRTGKPVLISTHTIPLEEQLVKKDLPAVATLVGDEVPVLLAKGKEHYVCPARLGALLQRRTSPELDQLAAWAGSTRTGDRAEAPPVSDALWREVNWTDAGPCAPHCERAATCPSHAERQRWQSAQGILVTNHHQFFADMALRASGGHLFALPGAIILDEAHALFDAARDVLGHQVALKEILGAVRAAGTQLRRQDPTAIALSALAQRFVETLQGRVAWEAGEEADRFAIRGDDDLLHAAEQLFDGALMVAEVLGGMKATPSRKRAISRLERAMAPLHGIMRPAAHIAWVEGDARRRQAFTLSSAPRDLANLFQERLFGREVPVILTSATLSLGGDFGYLQRELGLENPLTCSVGSPFDFSRQARLYMPDDLPDPGDDAEAFYAAATQRLKALLEATRGRALVLYTARSRAAEAARRLKAWGRFPILHQDRPSAQLIARFKQEGPSVLLGTAYWEGLDVPGESLSCVVVVKLPFAPGDPLIEADEQKARERGEDPFDAVLLPQMLLRLRQGTGRLIRRSTDRGVIAVLDPRASTRRYRDQVLASLPQAPLLDSLEGVRDFLT